MKKLKFNLQLFADIDSVIEAHKDSLSDADYKSQFSTISEKLSSLGYEVIINNKQKAEFVPSHRLGEVTAQRESYKTQVNELSAQLETLKKAAEGNATLQAQIQGLIDNNNELKAKMADQALSIAVMQIAADAFDPADIVSRVNKEAIKAKEDGKYEGIEKEVERIRKEKPYLFKPTAGNKGGSDFGGGQGGGEKLNMNMAIRRAAGRTTRL